MDIQKHMVKRIFLVLFCVSLGILCSCKIQIPPPPFTNSDLNQLALHMLSNSNLTPSDTLSNYTKISWLTQAAAAQAAAGYNKNLAGGDLGSQTYFNTQLSQGTFQSALDSSSTSSRKAYTLFFFKGTTVPSYLIIYTYGTSKIEDIKFYQLGASYKWG